MSVTSFAIFVFFSFSGQNVQYLVAQGQVLELQRVEPHRNGSFFVGQTVQSGIRSDLLFSSLIGVAWTPLYPSHTQAVAAGLVI